MKQLLWLEDDNDLVSALTPKIEDIGFTVTRFESPLYVSIPTVSEKYDVVLTDNQMPDMTGIAFIDFLRKQNLATPIILFSSDKQFFGEAIKLGANATIEKMDLNTLFITLGGFRG